MGVERFNADLFPLDHRAEAWNSALDSVGLATVGDEIPSGGRLLRHRAPQGTEFVLLISGSLALARLPTARDHAWLGLPLDGLVHLPDKTAVRERDIVCWPAGVGALFEVPRKIKMLLLRLPCEDARWGGLPDRLAADRAQAAQVDSTNQSVMASFLTTIADAMESGTSGVLAALEITLGEIMPMTLGLEAGSRATRAGLRRRILRALEEQLHDPLLAVQRFAESQGLSVRAVQKLLLDEGRSFSQHIRQRRLDRAAEALADPAQSAITVAEIGFRVGFTDPAHFSRAFRHHHGVAPNVYRADALATRRRTTSGVPPNRGHPRPVAHPDGIIPDRHAPPPRRDAVTHHHLRATPETVHWGYFSRDLPPVLTVRSGDTVTVETLTQHASDDATRMINGDDDAEAVFRWTDADKAIDRRGAGPLDASIYGRGAGEGFGVHILTGPIMIEQAMPGDIVEVEILDIAPRPSRSAGAEGRCFGSNAASWWGRQYGDLLTGPRPREIVTIYEIAECAGAPCAHAIYRFRWTPQRDPAGVMHETIDYPGVPVDPATIRPEHDILTGIHVPLRLHFGTIALAPDHPGPVDSVPPSCFGGNIDNWRLGAGSRIFLPVAVAGALLSIGDPHAAQGDGEISGTALECSLTGTIRIRLHTRGLADVLLRDLTYPLIETPENWIIQGFSEPDYLADLGAGAQSDIYRRASLDTAWRDAFRKARRFLMSAHGLDEDEAISLLSVAVDFGITQVVDGNWGVHAIVPKALFKRRQPHR